jgi:hypothetical protein
VDILSGLTAKPLTGTEAEATARAIERGVAGRLDELLVAYTQQWRDIADRGSRFDARLLPTVRSGNKRVFEILEMSQELNTAVTVFIDASSSMAPVWVETFAAAWAVSSILSRHEVPFAVYSFGSERSRSQDPQSHLGIIKGFSHRWEAIRGSQPKHLGGFTPTHAAMLRFIPDLVARPESRKIAMIITDGEPSKPAATLTLYKESAAAGVDLATVFLGDKGDSHQRTLAATGFQVARVSEPTDPRATARAIESALRSAFIRNCGAPRNLVSMAA